MSSRQRPSQNDRTDRTDRTDRSDRTHRHRSSPPPTTRRPSPSNEICVTSETTPGDAATILDKLRDAIDSLPDERDRARDRLLDRWEDVDADFRDLTRNVKVRIGQKMSSSINSLAWSILEELPDPAATTARSGRSGRPGGSGGSGRPGGSGGSGRSGPHWRPDRDSDLGSSSIASSSDGRDTSRDYRPRPEIVDPPPGSPLDTSSPYTSSSPSSPTTLRSATSPTSPTSSRNSRDSRSSGARSSRPSWMTAEHDAAVNTARDYREGDNRDDRQTRDYRDGRDSPDDRDSRDRRQGKEAEEKRDWDEEDQQDQQRRSRRQQKAAEEVRTAGWLLLGAAACLTVSRSLK
jgi:hypothetical protein